jgi:hypothetical protein
MGKTQRQEAMTFFEKTFRLGLEEVLTRDLVGLG